MNEPYTIKKPRHWLGSGPTKCDTCSRTLRTVFIDGRMHTGKWAFMCEPCSQKHGIGIGLGMGQRYEKQEDGRWMKTA